MKKSSALEKPVGKSESKSELPSRFHVELLVACVVALVAGILATHQKTYTILIILFFLINVFPFSFAIRSQYVLPEKELTVNKLGSALVSAGILGLCFGMPIVMHFELLFFAEGGYDWLISVFQAANHAQPQLMAITATLFVFMPLLGSISLLSIATAWLGFAVALEHRLIKKSLRKAMQQRKRH